MTHRTGSPHEMTSLKALATRSLQRLREAWNSRTRGDSQLRARATLELCFMAQGLPPERALEEAERLDGPGLVGTASAEFAHWANASVGEVFQRSYAQLPDTKAGSPEEKVLLDQHVVTWLLLEEPADSDAIARFQELTRSRAEALRLLSGLKQLLPQRD